MPSSSPRESKRKTNGGWLFVTQTSFGTKSLARHNLRYKGWLANELARAPDSTYSA